MYDSKRGVSKLGEVLSGRMRAINGMTPLPLDFGVIQDDYSLKTNTFAKPIPKTDYSVCRHLTLGKTGTYLTVTANDGIHSHGLSGTHGGHVGGDGSHVHRDEGPHKHDVLIPEKMRWIQPGDRVLVAWVQNEAVVVGIVTKL